MCNEVGINEMCHQIATLERCHVAATIFSQSCQDLENQDSKSERPGEWGNGRMET